MLTKPKHRHTLTLAVLIIALYGCTTEEAVSTEPSCDIEECKSINYKKTVIFVTSFSS